jgi:hypothetical protein
VHPQLEQILLIRLGLGLALDRVEPVLEPGEPIVQLLRLHHEREDDLLVPQRERYGRAGELAPLGAPCLVRSLGACTLQPAREQPSTLGAVLLRHDRAA